MRLKQLIILFVFSFSMMFFASNVSAITGNWLVCGNTECPGCSSANWDNCVWDGYNQYCPSSCNGGYSSSLSSSYGCYDNWDCPWDYYCSGGSCVYSGNSYYGGYECYDDWDCPNGYYCSGGSCVYSSYYDYYSTWDDCYYGNCYSTCDYDGYCDSWESSYSCSDCYYNYYDCNYNCGGSCPTPCPPTTCNHQNPKVVISPNSQQGTAGSMLTYTVTVENEDASNCGSSSFTLTPSCPSGWSCYLDTTSISISPGSTGSTTMRVTSSTYATGSNTISATASYSYGSGSGYATYVISGGSQNCNYALSISPNSGNLVDTGNWYITATDSSSGCNSPITYTVSYTLSGDCDSSSYASPGSFTISQSSTLSGAITVRGIKRTDSCTIHLSVRSPTGTTVASGSYSINPYGTCTGPGCGNVYYPQYYYPQYYPSYSMDKPKEIESATVPCQLPYEGEIPKTTVYAQSTISTPNESIYIILILALLFLLLLFALIAFLRWLRGDGKKQRTEKVIGKPRSKETRGFICWNKNGRESAEGF